MAKGRGPDIDAVADDEVTGAEVEEPKQGRSKLRLLLLVLPLVLVPATAGAWLAYDQYPALAAAAAEAGVNIGIDPAKEGEEPIEYGQFYQMTDLLVNPAGSNGKSFLLIELGLETKSSSVLDELKEKDIVIRDAILRRMGERTVQELSSIANRDVFKEDLRLTINDILQKGDIDRLYFTRYILQ